MYLESLRLSNFKNYQDLEIAFSNSLNCLVGDNGSGKTNLLDAIHYLSFTKSAFNNIDQQNIHHQAQAFHVKGVFKMDALQDMVDISYLRGQGKSIYLNKKNIPKASDLIGKLPVVMIAPNDVYNLLESSEARRKFFDMLISQMDRDYLENLIKYNRVLKQRNQMLKTTQRPQEVDHDLLGTYDELILTHGKRICDKRSEFIHYFFPFIQAHYKWICDEKESIGLTFDSTFNEADYKDVYRASLERDLVMQRTNVGIHKDDYKLKIKGHALKKYGSQGQQKSYLIAMKMAQFDVLREKNGFKPLLLWDDIFDKLDDHRIGKLVKMMEKHEFGQVFLTDARPERTRHFLKMLNIELKIFQVDDGVIKEISM